MDTVESYLDIDIRKWGQLLVPRSLFTWKWLQNSVEVAKICVFVEEASVTLHFRCKNAGVWQNVTQRIILEKTPCHLGGDRTWFSCPECRRRVAILYSKNAEFACRHCHNLNYRSQHLVPHERLAQRAHKMRDQLGWPYGFINGLGPRPKGMHRKTYWRLAKKAEAAVGNCILAAKAHFQDYDGFE